MYHDLSNALTLLFGADNINWATIATWASKTAGYAIRFDDAEGCSN